MSSRANGSAVAKQDVPLTKYHAGNLIPMFRKAAQLRNEMCSEGFSDNGGAIHSAERILDLLGLRLKYRGLSHINKLRLHPDAEFSVKAVAAVRGSGDRIKIEHVSPLRALTRRAIEKIGEGITDGELEQFVRDSYRLVILTTEESACLDRRNRTQLEEDRLAGIEMSTYRFAFWV